MLFWAFACAETEIDLDFFPDPVDYGTVVFTPEMPEEGFAQKDVEITNDSEVEIALGLPPYDPDHLCIEGFADPYAETELQSLGPGSFYILKVGICGHIAGEFDSQVETELSLTANGTRHTVVVTFFAQLSTETE